MTAPEFRRLPTGTIGRTTLGMIAIEAAAETEGDEAGVLMHLLAAFGAAAGPHVFADWSGRRTPARVFALVIGSTGSGKGLAEGIAVPLVQAAAPSWADKGIVTGLSSGEGLIQALLGDENDALGIGTEAVGTSLLVIEPEFARVLAAGKREGSTLTHILRDLWDRENAATMTKTNPVRVTGAHVCVVGHVTPRELDRSVDVMEIENGFLNRFLPVMVARGALRPFGAPTRHGNDAADALASALTAARTLRRVVLDPAARDRWEALYRSYAADRPGLVGALSARAIAHIQRLALIFALGDQSATVGVPHLDAAEAVWLRAAAAWVRLYGHQLGDPLADRLLAALREAPGDLTRTELRKAAGSNNIPAEKIEVALATLRAGGLAAPVPEVPRGPNGGRAAARWTATEPPRLGREGNAGNEAVGDASHSSLPPHGASSPSSHSSYPAFDAEGDDRATTR